MPARSSALKCSTAHAQAVKAQERWLIVNLLQDILVNVWHVEYTDELGGCKSGRWNAWYRWAVSEADGLYDTYLGELRAEGLLEDGP